MNEFGMIIPHEKLSVEALQRLVEEYVSRDGTDTGYTKAGLQDRVGQVMAQLRKGGCVIVFDEKHQTANIVPLEDLKKRVRGVGRVDENP